MLLSGMGPVGQSQTVAGKLFASLYAMWFWIGARGSDGNHTAALSFIACCTVFIPKSSCGAWLVCNLVCKLCSPALFA